MWLAPGDMCVSVGMIQVVVMVSRVLVMMCVFVALSFSSFVVLAGFV